MEELGRISVEVYTRGAEHAAERGILLADTKVEFGLRGDEVVLADEVLTPDSSRFWSRVQWVISDTQKKSPPGWDKQPVRDYGATIPTPFGVTGIGNLCVPQLWDRFF